VARNRRNHKRTKGRKDDERAAEQRPSSVVGRPSSIGSVMVVGAGIAGIQASLDLADSGYKVYLVESGTAIGGHMAQLDKTFPTNDCSMCTISPRLVAAGTHRNIEIITNAEVYAPRTVRYRCRMSTTSF